MRRTTGLPSISQGDSGGAGVPQWLGEADWLMVPSLKVVTMAAGWWLVGWDVTQSLSEPTADEPFLFLFGGLGLESSSS